MSIYSVDFRNFNVKGFCGLLNDKINAAYFCLTFMDDISNLMNRRIKNLSKVFAKFRMSALPPPFSE